MGNGCCRRRLGDLALVLDEELPEDEQMIAKDRRKVQRLEYYDCGQLSLIACVGLLVIYVVILSVLCSISLMMPLPETCAVEDFDMHPFPKPFPVAVGTSINIADTKWPVDVVDLTGVWWIRWDHAGAVSSWNGMHMELLLSFALAVRVLDGDHGPDTGSEHSLYPLILKQFTQTPGLWGYTDSYFSWAYELLSGGAALNQENLLTFTFTNRSHALVTGGQSLVKKNEDEWVRAASPAEMAASGGGGGGGGVRSYTLTRIIDELGEPHPKWWPVFEDFMGTHHLRMWGDHSHCRRRCELVSMSLLAPASTACKLCGHAC